jgi:predicted Zn-dependent protease
VHDPYEVLAGWPRGATSPSASEDPTRCGSRRGKRRARPGSSRPGRYGRLFEEHPDYFFARIGMARLAVREHQLDRARELLRPLLEQQRFHISEFDALCNANAELYFAEGSRDGARSWVDLWASVNPNHPGIAQWRRKLAQPG